MRRRVDQKGIGGADSLYCSVPKVARSYPVAFLLSGDVYSIEAQR